MRYKVIEFYLPMSYAMIGSRIHHFEIESFYFKVSHFEIESVSSIISEHPGSVYSDDARDYYRIDNTDIYRATTTGYPSNFFVKIVVESDPMFNFDYAYNILNDDDIHLNIDIGVYKGVLVPQFVDSSVLNLPR
jgi:hypothetical protein